MKDKLFDYIKWKDHIGGGGDGGDDDYYYYNDTELVYKHRLAPPLPPTHSSRAHLIHLGLFVMLIVNLNCVIGIVGAAESAQRLEEWSGEGDRGNELCRIERA